MVHRTPASKFGVQIDGVKAERRVASFKPGSSSSSSSQNPDGKNRAADLKKKMKQSRAIQLSDFESLASSPVRKSVSPIRTSGGSPPNYMKSTSCFDARKEVSPVSSRNSRICSDGKKPRGRNLEDSAHGSVSGRNTTRCLTKSPSGKLVRSLTKTTSFKKSSRVALCADMDSHRATCSSTLKDSKFPAYLMLSDGATECKGTSAMKVCPYTYCSLNGHRHAPLPPLKCFLSARRRLLKTQKNMKVEPSGCKVKGAGEEMVTEGLVNDGGLDFFVEVYAESKVDGAGSVNQETVVTGDCVRVSSSTMDNDTESSNKEDDKPVAEYISDGSMDSEVDLSEEAAEGIFFHGDEYEDEDDAGSTDTEMEEWGEQQFLSMENDGLDDLENHSNVQNGDLSVETRLHNEELVGSGYIVKDTQGVFFGSDKEFNEKSGDLEEQFVSEDFELNHHPGWEVEEAYQVSESLSFDQLSYLEDAFDEMDATQAVDERAEIEYLDLILNSELEAEVVETYSVTQAKGEASNNEQKNQDLQVDGAKIVSGVSNSCLDVTDGDCVETNEGHCGIHEEVLQFDCQIPNHGLVLQEESLDADVSNQMENGKQLDEANNGEELAEAEISSGERSDKCLNALFSDGQSQDISTIGSRNLVAEQDETESSIVLEMTGNEEPSDLKIEETSSNDNSIVPVDIVEGKDAAKSSVKAAKSSHTAIDSSQELDLSGKNWELNIKGKRVGEEPEVPRNFNPREPNYLPLVPDPDAEKVDLKHQMIDDRKNAEEWMLDYALQRSVTKLAPAKKKKVALLVEAFESVMPTSRYEIHIRNNASEAFTPAKRIQACF